MPSPAFLLFYVTFPPPSPPHSHHKHIASATVSPGKHFSTSTGSCTFLNFSHLPSLSSPLLNLAYHSHLACERRRISGCRLSPPKNNVCEPEPGNDFCDVRILSQSQFSSSNPRTTARGIRCEKHSSFILSQNLIGQRETKIITSQKSFPGSGSQTLFFGGDKRQPEIRLRSQANSHQTAVLFFWFPIDKFHIANV